MECACYFASFNGITFNRQPKAYVLKLRICSHPNPKRK
jgi:hypothetical protein